MALVLGDWTGIPVSKMLEAESEKLLKMEERLAERVVGQDEAVRAVSRPCAAGASGCAIRASPSGRSSSSGRAASARPSSPRRSPSSSSTTSSR